VAPIVGCSVLLVGTAVGAEEGLPEASGVGAEVESSSSEGGLKGLPVPNGVGAAVDTKRCLDTEDMWAMQSVDL
jgi:hypothetical protein